MPCIRLLVGERERANLVVQTARLYTTDVRRVSAHRYALLFIRNHVLCYLRMRQDNELLHDAMMARADTVIVCSLPLAKNGMHSPTSIIYIRASVDALYI